CGEVILRDLVEHGGAAIGPYLDLSDISGTEAAAFRVPSSHDVRHCVVDAMKVSARRVRLDVSLEDFEPLAPRVIDVVEHTARPGLGSDCPKVAVQGSVQWLEASDRRYPQRRTKLYRGA